MTTTHNCNISNIKKYIFLFTVSHLVSSIRLWLYVSFCEGRCFPQYFIFIFFQSGENLALVTLIYLFSFSSPLLCQVLGSQGLFPSPLHLLLAPSTGLSIKWTELFLWGKGALQLNLEQHFSIWMENERKYWGMHKRSCPKFPSAELWLCAYPSASANSFQSHLVVNEQFLTIGSPFLWRRNGKEVCLQGGG